MSRFTPIRARLNYFLMRLFGKKIVGYDPAFGNDYGAVVVARKWRGRLYIVDAWLEPKEEK